MSTGISWYGQHDTEWIGTLLTLLLITAGVPRILEGSLPPQFSASGEPDWSLYEEYLRTARININVRQVFPKGFDPQLPPLNAELHV